MQQAHSCALLPGRAYQDSLPVQSGAPRPAWSLTRCSLEEEGAMPDSVALFKAILLQWASLARGRSRPIM